MNTFTGTSPFIPMGTGELNAALSLAIKAKSENTKQPETIADLRDEHFRNPRLARACKSANRLINEQHRYRTEMEALPRVATVLGENSVDVMLSSIRSLQGRDGIMHKVMALYYANPAMGKYIPAHSDIVPGAEGFITNGISFDFNQNPNIVSMFDAANSSCVYIVDEPDSIKVGLARFPLSADQDVDVVSLIVIPDDESKAIRFLAPIK